MTNCILSCLADFNITFEDVARSIELILLLVGCIIAGMGLKTWRQQVIEQPKIELARDIVESFYIMKNCFHNIRKPYTPFNLQEIQTYFKKEDISEFQASYLYRIYLLDTQYADKILNFQNLREKAKVYYSKDIQHCFDNMLSLINRFQHACITYVKDMDMREKDRLPENLISKFYNIIHEIEENDVLNKEIDNIITEVEYNLKPIYETKTIKWKKLKSETKDKTNDQ